MQPIALPGDPARQVDKSNDVAPVYVWTLYTYFRDTAYNEKGEVIDGPKGPYNSYNEPNEEYDTQTKDFGSAKQQTLVTQIAADEAVSVISPRGLSHGGIILPRSKRWIEFGGTGTAYIDFAGVVTKPNPALDGSAVGPYDAVFGSVFPLTCLFGVTSRRTTTYALV